MAFLARWTREADTAFRQLQTQAETASVNRQGRSPKASQSEGLFKQVEKCVRLLLENPKHPGLHTHEYGSIENPYNKKEKVFEAYVQNRTPGAYRLFWCYGPEKGEITLIAIVPHP